MEIQLDFITGQDEKGEDIVETKTFVANSPKALLVRRATELEKEVNFSHFTPETLDLVADYICQIYKNKFTRDDLYNGLDSDKLFSTYTSSVERIIHGAVSRLETFPQEQ